MTEIKSGIFCGQKSRHKIGTDKVKKAIISGNQNT